VSVQVSYKKQTLLGIIGLLILFLVIEGIANVWWITQINCEFEENEIFLQMDGEERRQLCLDLYDVKTSGMELIPNQESESITINSLGFRGGEFSPEKTDLVYRIFMLGGSTMFGHGATSDETTIPGFTQKILNDHDIFNVEVINAGIQGADSFDELSLVKTKLLDYNPNMIIVYDGWNDLREQNSVGEISDNWNFICKLGKQNNFEVIIALQPIAGFGNKHLTEQEFEYSQTGTNYNDALLINYLENYQDYSKKLRTLSDCTDNVDLRDVFDDEKSPIYWDQGHVSDLGNSLVAEKIYESILPFVSKEISYEIKPIISSDIKNVSTFENQIQYFISHYKTPIMVGSFLNFENIDTLLDNDKSSDEKPQRSFFETQSKQYEGDSISINIEVIKDENQSQPKMLNVKTINNSDNSEIPHVTYFLTIKNNNEIILSDFFYTEGEILTLKVYPNNSDLIDISGERKYDHNALIANPESPVIISGPILIDDQKYNFDIELRTIYDPSNWVFILDNFNVEIIS